MPSIVAPIAQPSSGWWIASIGALWAIFALRNQPSPTAPPVAAEAARCVVGRNSSAPSPSGRGLG
jgi:hypothetical protein